MPIPAGRTIRGYELQELIGEGGYGMVYRAYQPSVGRQVAVKVILPQFVDHPEFVLRFEEEAKFVARLEHPHIVPLYDYWRGPDGAYLVMRWLRGGNLYESLKRGPWELNAAVRLLDQITNALSVAHRQGVVHRDVKPENIMLDEDGNAYLSDFGIAKDLMREVVKTATGAFHGSLLYISPEQAQSQPVTPQSDLYSLGIVMYEVLTGEHPFAGETPANQLVKLLTEPLPPLRERCPDLPAALEDVIRRTTAKDPLERYPDALAFAAEFREAVSSASAENVESIPATEIPSQLPAFLKKGAETDVFERRIFVARERELERLKGFLEMALEGKGRVAFITGGPGRGKTALLGEFAQQAMHAHPNLLVAMGNCNSYSGIGDPCLPFREIMGMLSGDVETLWAAGTISREHARRLWSAVPHMVRALLDRGPHLFETFVPSEALLTRSTTAFPEDRNLLEALRDRVGRRVTGAEGLEQSHLFEQFTNVLRTLGDKHNLLLILDDLQWADASSTSLLFHLGRRLEGTRILIAGAYRPEEVALGRDGERHPLEKALAEFKRSFGNIWIDLTHEEETESRRFVDAYLDSQPNRLDQNFRRALCQHTGGHALFTIELLRAMQARGDLLQDEEGWWIKGSSIDWEWLPTRVEAVIEERFNRLDAKLREILTVASVEGEDFTAQVIARVQEIPERKLLRLLSTELEKRHHLVREVGGLSVGSRKLSRYRFAHLLFQQYLYNELGEGERLLLHREVARTLEELYTADDMGQIAEQLARHYAGDSERECYYLRLAGERALRRFANAEALRYFSRALTLTPEDDFEGRYKLLLAREAVYNLLGERDAQKKDLEELRHFAELLDDPAAGPGQAEVATRWAKYTGQTDYLGSAQLAEHAVSLAKLEGKPVVAVQSYITWAHALRIQGKNDAATLQAEAGLSIARKIEDRRFESRLLNILGLIALDQRDTTSARVYFEQSLAIAREISDQLTEAQPLNNIGLIAGSSGDYKAAQECYEQALKIAREIGNRRGEGLVLGNLGWIAAAQGDYTTARAYYEQNQRIAREVGDRYYETYAAINISMSAMAQGDYHSAMEYTQQGLELARDTGDRSGEAWSLTFLGHVCVEMDNLMKAAEVYQEALDIRRSLDQPNLATEPLAGLARVSLKRNDIAAARAHVGEILVHLDDGGTLDGTEEPLRVWLTCFYVLQADKHPRAESILEKAHKLLQARAAEISDETLRRTFLQEIPYHSEIVTAWKEHQNI